MLVQLAPDHARDDDRVRYFLSLLPSWLRVALEFRHPSWHHEDVFAMLEHYQGPTQVSPSRPGAQHLK